nr:hypothetical protein [Phascolarctobacterium sp.]
MDCSKLKNVFGWNPRWHITEAVAKTVEWAKVYKNNGNISKCMEKQIKEFWEDKNNG